ncbi:regulatory-associated protein of mTOR isoform X2 [Onthophagus taurus]|uniref:regulatory-associated protein of mTOR isoform X2 n=1 Tax=Onthophagus taurus TaxID=166361 RepID=UPI000C206162|nr:regulatory-associated protein of mTOR isoform X2 [Onthophagus taurus]
MIDIRRNGEDDGRKSQITTDRNLPLVFAKPVHTDVIEGVEGIQQNWRMKERMKTVSVALVLCLNVGVDPPDVVKTQPCARLECWIDPSSMSPSKALQNIGANLQKQYERWQPRARYKQSLDPTSDDIKKLCSSLRRNAKEERVLFHYNGHGVPKPTSNGEIWVFNRQYTQYIPLSIYDLQKWMGAPSIYVYDCSNAGIIVESFKQFASQHETETEAAISKQKPVSVMAPSFKNCIQLAACSANQVLPMNPSLPADLFTSCLTTPIKVVLRWYVLQSNSILVPKINPDLLDKFSSVPGQITDRRTMLGELNWIFTAITDTIAWNTLPRDLFQKLFRQDLLVASLFRNFLLAERIMRSYDCTPISDPPLPPTYQHHMWQTWDLMLDLSLLQLRKILDHNEPYEHLPFFEEQLLAFEVWLKLGNHLGSENRKPPEQLPIVLQVLLSQVHRMKALELLGKFLDLGPWAVNLALSVGIFPYVLKLLQSSAKELRPLLVFIWAKILAVDDSCQSDLVRDNGHRYFIAVLQDLNISSETRMQAAFVLASIVNKNPDGQEITVQNNLVSTCLEQLSDPNPKLRQWLALCLGRLWDKFEKARWTGVRDTAHEKLYTLLSDRCPEVRASAVYALGTFINSVQKRTEHANNIDHSVIMTLINTLCGDMSAIVRKELVVAIQWIVLAFENTFINIASQEASLHVGPKEHTPLPGRWGSESGRDVKTGYDVTDCALLRMTRVGSLTAISSMGSISWSIYTKVWAGLCALNTDPHPEVAKMANTVICYVRNQTTKPPQLRDSEKIGGSVSLPPSPNTRPVYLPESPPTLHPDHSGNRTLPTASRSRYHPNTISEREVKDYTKKMLVSTQFIQWSCKQFVQPMMKQSPLDDVESRPYHEREWRFIRNDAIRKEAQEERRKATAAKIETQIFNARNPGQCPPTVLQFHPYDQHVAVVISDSVIVWDWGTGAKLSYSNYKTLKNPLTYITSFEWVNSVDVSLMMLAANDGSVKIWKPAVNNKDPTLIGAWQAFTDASIPKKLYMKILLMWEQYTQTVITAGESKLLRLWDAHQETHLYDIPTGSERTIHCIDSTYSGIAHERELSQEKEYDDDLMETEENGLVMMDTNYDEVDTFFPTKQSGLIAAGFTDGSVRIYDRRCGPNEAKLRTWMEHDCTVLGVQMRDEKVVMGSAKGEIKIFDIRGHDKPLKSMQIGQQMSAFAIHRTANIYSCATGQNITQYTLDGNLINTIRSSESFIGYRTGSNVMSLSYHPYKMALAASTVDVVCVYAAENRQR